MTVVRGRLEAGGWLEASHDVGLQGDRRHGRWIFDPVKQNTARGGSDDDKVGRVQKLARGRARGWAWRALACAVLLGLWVMHGMFSDPATGCHGGGMTLVSAPRSVTPPAPHAVADQRAQAAVTDTGTSAMGDGDLCLSARVPTPGHDLRTLITLLFLGGLGVLMRWAPGHIAPGLFRRTERRWRAPPGATGWETLLMVCVART